MDTIEKKGSLLSGSLLIAGTSIGAGMLGIPLVTGLAGFAPCIAANLISWFFMMCTGLLFLEATLWMEDGANVLSMSKRFLGTFGQAISGASFIFLYYCLLTAYFAAGSPLFLHVLQNLFGLCLSSEWGFLLFFSVFFLILFLGLRITDRMNFLLISGMTLSYVILIGMGSSEVEAERLTSQNWPLSILSFPVLFSAYGYHNVIPSISTYLKRNVKKLRLSIIIGSSIPLIVYSIWQWMIVGSLPRELLIETLEKGAPVTEALHTATKNPWMSSMCKYFSLFAIVTSVLGVSLSMIDFFGDGLKIKERSGFARFPLCFLVFFPPLCFVWIKPTIFSASLELAGGFGEAILNGLIPIMMVWVGRYHMGLPSVKPLFGGKIVLSLLALFTLFIVVLETVLLYQGSHH